MAEGISVKLTAVPVSGPPLLVPDVKDVSDLAGYDLPGPLYVPVPGNIEIPYTSRVAISMEEGSIRALELAGDIVVEFILSTKFLTAVGGGTTPTVDYIPDETPSGAIDGFNTSYTLAFTPTTFVGLYLNGQKIVGGVDYTRTGTAISMTIPPTPGESLRADYIKGGTVIFEADETPAGLVNGINDTFTTAFTPVIFVGVFVNGLKQLPGGGLDYTIVSSTITFTAGSIPQVGDTIRVDYIR